MFKWWVICSSGGLYVQVVGYMFKWWVIRTFSLFLMVLTHALAKFDCVLLRLGHQTTHVQYTVKLG